MGNYWIVCLDFAFFSRGIYKQHCSLQTESKLSCYWKLLEQSLLFLSFENPLVRARGNWKCYRVCFAHPKCEDKLNIKKTGGKSLFRLSETPSPVLPGAAKQHLFLLFGAQWKTKGGEKSLCEHEPVWPPVTSRVGIGSSGSRNSSKKNKTLSSGFQTALLCDRFSSSRFSRKVDEAFSGAFSWPLSSAVGRGSCRRLPALLSISSLPDPPPRLRSGRRVNGIIFSFQGDITSIPELADYIKVFK